MPPKNQPFTTDIKRRRNSLSSRRHFDKLSLQQLPDVETTKDLGIDDIYIRLFLAGNLKLNIYINVKQIYSDLIGGSKNIILIVTKITETRRMKPIVTPIPMLSMSTCKLGIQYMFIINAKKPAFIGAYCK